MFSDPVLGIRLKYRKCGFNSGSKPAGNATSSISLLTPLPLMWTKSALMVVVGSCCRCKLRKMKQTLAEVLKQFPDRPYGEFIPGGNTRGPDEAEPVLKRLKEFYGSDPKDKKQRDRKNKK